MEEEEGAAWRARMAVVKSEEAATTKAGKSQSGWLKILVVMGLLTGIVYLTEKYNQPVPERWHEGVVVEKFEALDPKWGPTLVFTDDSLHQNIPLNVSWACYVNMEEGDSIRVRLRDNDKRINY